MHVFSDVIDDIVEGCKQCGPVKKHVAPADGAGKTKVSIVFCTPDCPVLLKHQKYSRC